jgi:hypothetical protein
MDCNSSSSLCDVKTDRREAQFRSDAAEQGQIDVALVVGQEHRPSAQVFGELEVGWITGRGFAPTSGQPLPLVLLGPQCAFRKAAIGPDPRRRPISNCARDDVRLLRA